MMFWLYAKHHWRPSDIWKMSRGEKTITRAFFLHEVELQKELAKGALQ